MPPSFQRYIERSSVHRDWPTDIALPNSIDTAVVIPAYDEAETLPLTLNDLAAQPSAAHDRTAIICVVNNPPGEYETSRGLLAWLRDENENRFIIDAASPGREISTKHGVGLARRIGMDHAVRAFAETGRDGIIVSLDADTRVDTNYLTAIHEYFDEGANRAAVIDYAHPTDTGDSPIIRYEIFLRYYVLGLHAAGSPYAFHTIGSAMAFRACAYCEAAGMPKRPAAEDFYMLQKLAKCTDIGYIAKTTVVPSPRVSHRVPFGTGAAMLQHERGERALSTLHDPRIFGILKRWLDVAAGSYRTDVEEVVKSISNLSEPLAQFLGAQRIAETWPRLQSNAADAASFRRAFHAWFDALATLRCAHHLRDCAYPDVPTEEAVRGLLGDAAPAEGSTPREILYHLRAFQSKGADV